jgi:phage/plasmid-associated DNA primase
LDKLASESFSKELLIKSRVNFCAEQKKSYLDSEEIKKIVTGDRIEIERKFKISLTFTPKTKIIVACNGLPKFNDTTHAIYRRMILIRFHNQYVSESAYQKIKNPEKMNIHLMDKNLIEKIRLEKSAILNMFIEGLIDLRKNNYEFVESQDSIQAMLEFKRDSDTVREFLEDNYETSETIETSINDVYESYRQWYGRFVSGSPMKFRINELGKRICDIFSVKSSGQKWSYSNEQQKSIRQTFYPIKIKEEPLEDLPVLTAEEAKVQLNIDLTKPI